MLRGKIADRAPTLSVLSVYGLGMRIVNQRNGTAEKRRRKTLVYVLKKNSAKLHPALNRPFLKKDQSTAMLSESKHKSGQMRPADPLPTLHENTRLRSI